MLVIGLDGFPHSLLMTMTRSGTLPFLSRLVAHPSPHRMTSVHPTISSVAWATYATGKNPGNHNIYGFLDRTLNPFSLILPNRAHLTSTTLWRRLSDHQIPVIVLNVPVSYPPEPVNGILVGDFLGVDIHKIAFPSHISGILKRFDYVIDADTSLLTDPDRLVFLNHLISVLQRRVDTFLHLLETHSWEFAQLHIMETDRLFHFYWRDIEQAGDSRLHQTILEFFRQMDTAVERIFSCLKSSDEVILLSDHGFCRADHEIQINTWLQEHGFLTWNPHTPAGLESIAPGSLAYSLIPGRIFLNLAGREPNGCVRIEDRDAVLTDLESGLRSLTVDGDQPVAAGIMRREALYHGSVLSNAADLIVMPHDGIELKGKLGPAPLVAPSKLHGMHTWHDAFVWSRHGTYSPGKTGDATLRLPGIIDLYPTILSYYSITDPESEGKAIFQW